MKITETAIAGTLESGDVMVRIAPLSGAELEVHIASSVKRQFGAAIRATVMEILSAHGISGAELHIDDKGALDCVLRARVETALMRGARLAALPWEDK